MSDERRRPQSAAGARDASLPLLAYNLETDTSPLRASSRASLTCVASNLEPARPVNVYSIAITLRIGTTAADLTTSTSGIATPNPDGWTAQIDSGGLYTAVPASSAAGRIAAHGVSLQLGAIDVNREIGATTIYIDEEASDATHTRAVRSTQFTLAKFPHGFTLSNLTAVPASIESGDAVNALWTGTDMPGLVTYKLRWISQDIAREADVDWTGPKRLENLDSEPSTLLTLEAHVAGAPPEIRQFSVDVTPRVPVIDTFRGDLLGAQIQLTWSARNAIECNLDQMSVRLDPAGTLTLPLDRFHHTLVAKNRSKQAVAALDLQFAASATAQADVPWRMIAATPDGSTLVALTQRECFLLDGITLSRVRTLGPNQWGTGTVAISQDGKRIFISAVSTGTLYDASFQPIQTTTPVHAAAFSPDGEWLYTVFVEYAAYWLRRYTASRLEKVYEVRVPLQKSMSEATGICVTPGGDRVFVFTCDDYEYATVMRRFDAATGALTGTFAMGYTGQSSSNPSYVFSWRTGGRVAVATRADFVQPTLDADTMQPWDLPLPFFQIAMTGGEIVGERWNDMKRDQVMHLDVVDRETMQTVSTTDIPMAFWARSPMAVAPGAFYVTDNTYQVYRVTRYGATSAARTHVI